MSYSINTTPGFEKSVKALAKRYSSIKTDLLKLMETLSENPFQGVELSPGIRKIRMSIASKGRGKSGGARIITYTISVDKENGRVYMIDIYDKADHSSVDVKIIGRIISELEI